MKKQTSSLNIYKTQLNQTQAAPYEISQVVTENSVQNIAPTTIKKVTNLIGETRDKETPGMDMISGTFLKKLPSKTVTNVHHCHK